MALTVSDRGTGTFGSASSPTTIGGRTATLAAGSMGVLCINTDNAGSGGAVAVHPTSATDSVGNVWTRRVNQVGDFGASNAGFEYSIYTATIQTALLTTDTLQLTWVAVSPPVGVWTWYEVGSSLGVNVAFNTSGTIAAATAANASITTGTIPVGDAVIALYASEQAGAVTGDSDTTNGTWTAQQTAQTGVTTSGQRIASQGKVQTTTPSTQTYNVTVASGDRGAGYIVLHENYASPEVATGTGTALDPTTDISNGGDPTSVDAGLATGTGEAYSSRAAFAEPALGSGAALDASVHIKPTDQFDESGGSVPTVVNWGSFTSGAGAPSVGHPASIAAGDLLVAFFAVRNTGLLAPNTGAGWAEHPDSPVWNGSTSGTAGAAIHVFYKIATGSESGSLGGWGTASEYVGRMGAFRGVNQTDPFNVTASNSTTGSASPASLPTAATTVANCRVVIALSIGTATAPAPGAMSNSVLTSQTNVGSQNTTSDNDAYLNIQHGINASAGLWGATTISKNTNSGYAIIGISITSGIPGGGSGQAYDATVSTTAPPVEADAEVATGTGAAADASAHVRPAAALAAGTATTGDAVGLVALLRRGRGRSRLRGRCHRHDYVGHLRGFHAASGTGTAAGATPLVAPNAGLSNTTGAANDATVAASVSAAAGLAAGTGTAFDAAASGATNVGAGLASGTGVAADAIVDAGGAFLRTLTDSVPIGTDEVLVDYVTPPPPGPPVWDPADGPPPPDDFPWNDLPYVSGVRDVIFVSAVHGGRGAPQSVPPTPPSPESLTFAERIAEVFEE